MNPHTLLEVAPLPAAVTSLLDSFVHSHALRDMKVWSRANGEWARVYPRTDITFDESASAAPMDQASTWNGQLPTQ